MNIFNIFKKKPENISYSRKLIYLKDGELGYQLSSLESYLNSNLKYLGIYSDKPHIKLYQVYRKHYQLYDIVPDLLYFKAFQCIIDYVGEYNLSLNNEAFLACMPDLNRLNIPDRFLMPEMFKPFFTELHCQVSPYVTSDVVSLKDYMNVVNCCWINFVNEQSKDSINHYVKSSSQVLASYAKDDCGQTITNIINRLIDKYFNKGTDGTKE